MPVTKDGGFIIDDSQESVGLYDKEAREAKKKRQKQDGERDKTKVDNSAPGN